MPVTTGMKAAGYYDKNSSAQLASMQLVFDWMEKALAEMPLPPVSQPFTALDLGSSEGRNALIAMNVLVEAVRRRQADQPIQTIYSDLSSNNFNRLFLNLAEARASGQNRAGVFPLASAGSFYEPRLPPRSVHFAMCFNSLLWMDTLPSVPVPDFVVYRRPHPPRPGLHVPAETTEAYLRQAERDLVTFLEVRAQELVPGGKLLIVSPGDSDQHRLADGIYDVLNDACLDLVAEGRLERRRYEGFTMPLYFRTVAETVAPLEREGSPVKGLYAVDRAETLEVPTPFLVEFDRSGDRARLADDYTGFLRAFSEPVARAALVGKDGEEGILDALYGRIHARIQAEPERYRFRYLLSATLFTRS